jgi:WD40 repeat protein
MYTTMKNINTDFDDFRWVIQENWKGQIEYWIMKASKTSEYYNITPVKDVNGNDIYRVVPNNVEIIEETENSVAITQGGSSFILATPKKEIKAPFQSLECFDVSNGEELLALGGPDGDLTIYSISGTRALNSLNGHLGDVNVAKFLPGNKLLVSGSSDMQICIWELFPDSPTPFQTAKHVLRGHRGSIQRIGLIDDGIVSVSKDGFLKVWNLNQVPKEVASFSIQQSCGAIHGLASVNPNEWWVVGEKGNIVLVDIRLKNNNIISSQCESKSLSSIAVSVSNHIIVGSKEGEILYFDFRSPKLLNTRKRGARINDICVRNNSFITASTDGSVSQFSLDNADYVVEYSSGNGIDGARGICAASESLYCTRKSGYVNIFDFQK